MRIGDYEYEPVEIDVTDFALTPSDPAVRSFIATLPKGELTLRFDPMPPVGMTIEVGGGYLADIVGEGVSNGDETTYPLGNLRRK